MIATSRKPLLEDFQQEMDARLDGKMYVSDDKSFAAYIGRPRG